MGELAYLDTASRVVVFPGFSGDDGASHAVDYGVSPSSSPLSALSV